MNKKKRNETRTSFLRDFSPPCAEEQKQKRGNHEKKYEEIMNEKLTKKTETQLDKKYDSFPMRRGTRKKQEHHEQWKRSGGQKKIPKTSGAEQGNHNFTNCDIEMKQNIL